MDPSARSPRPAGRLAVLMGLAALAFAGLVSLGLWQVHRLAWKEALIARVERNTNAAPEAFPAASAWDSLRRDESEYRRVELLGRYQGADTLVRATTALGMGSWVMTPLVTGQGFTVLVDRGFVPSGEQPRRPSCDPCRVVGLLRWSEPGGAFLQANDPAHGRWTSRDVAAIAAAHAVPGPVAPFFVDEEAGRPPAPGWPRAGLTVLRFSNNHAVYAVTWFALAAMVACAAGYLVVDERRLKRLHGGLPRSVHVHR